MIRAIIERLRRRGITREDELIESRDTWKVAAQTNATLANQYRVALRHRQDHCLRLEAQVERLKDEHRLACEKCRRIDAMDAKIREEMSDEKRTG